MNEESKRTKVKCSARFELATIHIMQLDEENTTLIDSSLIKAYITELWDKGEIEPCGGTEHHSEETYDGSVDEILAFEIIKPTPTETFNPNQTTLPL